MDPRTAATRVPDPEAVEFIRFCYQRRRVGWPELYDEMCAVAARGLFRGLVTEDLASHGIGFSLFDMPALAALSTRIVVEEQALRRPVAVVIAPAAEGSVEMIEDDVAAHVAVEIAAEVHTVPMPVIETVVRPSIEPPSRGETSIRFAVVPAGA